jgi:hypothetical protein
MLEAQYVALIYVNSLETYYTSKLPNYRVM